MQPKHRNLAVSFGVSVFLAMAVWFVFGQTFRYPFVNYDDPGYVTANPAVMSGLSWNSFHWAFTHVHGGNWHPLTTLSHMLDCQLFGLNPGPQHLVNVLLHTIAAVLLFVVLRRMTGGPSRTGSVWCSAFVAAIFAVHPLRVESVAWIAERKDVLSGVFFVLTLGAYVLYAARPSFIRYLTLAVLFVLGLMTKPMLVNVPLVFLLLDYWPLQRIVDSASLRKCLLEKIPLLLLSAASCVATFLAQKQALANTEIFPLSWRMANAIVSYIVYVRQMFWPVGLNVFYPHPEDRLSMVQVVGAAILLLGMTVFAILSRKNRPYILVGWLWYLVMLVPVLGLVQVGLYGHADRYTYLPQIGLYLLGTWLIVDLTKAWRYQRMVLATAATVIVAASAIGARIQTRFWHDSESLWTRALAVTENNDVAHMNLSEILVRSGRYEEAIPHCQEAIRIYANNPQAYYNLGLAYLRTRRVNVAMTYLKRTLELRPDHVNAALTIAWVLATSPDPSLRDGSKAVQFAEISLNEGGRANPTLLHTLAAAYAEVGRFDEALSTAYEAFQLAKAQQNSNLMAELQLNLQNYTQHQPLRDDGLANALPER